MSCGCGSCDKSSKWKEYGVFGILLAIFLITLGYEIFSEDSARDAEVLELIYLVLYVFIGFKILKNAFVGILKREFFNENSLMAIASLAAFAIGEGAEGVAILLFFRVGEYIEEAIVAKSKKKINALNALKSEKARILENNKEIIKDPKLIKKGDVLLVRAGERILADGVVLAGVANIDTAAINGESLPLSVEVGDNVLSGSINTDGVLQIRTTSAYCDSTFSKIIRLIEEGAAKKSRAEEFITKFARIYTPLVAIVAAFIAFLPPLFLSIFSDSTFVGEFSTWLYRGIIFLVVSCPCALVISIPLTFFAALARASQGGILIKGSSYLEGLFNLNCIAFDKTGTLTSGILRVQEVKPYSVESSYLLSLAKSIEAGSNHPLALALREVECDGLKCEVSKMQEIAGNGVKCEIDGRVAAAGRARFVERFCKIPQEFLSGENSEIFVGIDGKFIGKISFCDSIKKEAESVIRELRKCGIAKVCMLSGDKISVAESVGKQLTISEVYAELSPKDKLEYIEKLKAKNVESQGKFNAKSVAFVGDGLNDAPSLIASDVGISLGQKGVDVALESADIVILNDNLNGILEAVKIAKKTRKILWQNIAFALGVKGLIMLGGAFGFVNLWIALFGDVGVAILALLNALRAIR